MGNVTNDFAQDKFTTRLKELRGEKSLQEVSSAIGISRVSLGYYETGNRKPDTEILYKIAKFYGVSSDYLIGLSDVQTLDIDIQAISAKTGLSEKSIEQLSNFTTYSQGKVRLAIIDYLLRNVKFSFALTDNINDYYSKYDFYKNGKETYFRESEELHKLSKGDLVKELELESSGAYTQTLGRRELAEREEAKEAAHFRIIKAFDNLLENLVTYFYDKNNKTSHTD